MKLVRAAIQGFAGFLLAVSRWLVPEDLSGPRVLKVRVRQASEAVFEIYVTDVKTGQWVKQTESYPSSPLLQADMPNGTLREFLLHTAGRGDRSNYAIYERNWKYGMLTLDMVPKIKEAYYHAVVAFLKASNREVGEEETLIAEFPADHMFCREIAATWWNPEFGDGDKGWPYYFVKHVVSELVGSGNRV